jgi:MYXO-CTERM domain-containing protein
MTMIRLLVSATLVALLPLSSASGATFTYDTSATLTLTSVEGGPLSVNGGPGNVAITPLLFGVDGAESTFGGTTEQEGSLTEVDAGIAAEVSGSGATGQQLSFARSSAGGSAAFAISTNGLSAVTANFTLAFDHRISTTARFLSSTASVSSVVRLTEFRNGVASQPMESVLLLNTGFSPGGPAAEQAEDSGTLAFSFFVPQGVVLERSGLFLTIEASGQAQTYAEATPAPIPVPPSAAMFAAGLGLFTLLRRSRKARGGSRERA